MGVNNFHDSGDLTRDVHGCHVRSKPPLKYRFGLDGICQREGLFDATADTGERRQNGPVLGYPVPLCIVNGFLTDHDHIKLRSKFSKCYDVDPLHTGWARLGIRSNAVANPAGQSAK